jgi:hypothetical protein
MVLLRKEILFMRVPINTVSSTAIKEEQPPIATFKTSLRAWQVRYKARLAAQAVVSEKSPNQTTPA